MKNRQTILLLSLCFVLWKIQAQNPFVTNRDAEAINCNCYRLTPDSSSARGSVWNENTISLKKSFDFSFDVFLGCKNGSGADGIAFLLQPISTGVGSNGGGIGYQNIRPSVAIELDTYHNRNNDDPVYDHIAITTNGQVHHGRNSNKAGPVPATPDTADIEDCAYHEMRIVWNADTYLYEVYFDGDLRTSTTLNLIDSVFGGETMVYWGFTASTGARKNEHRFCTNIKADFTPDNVCAGNPQSFKDLSYSNLSGGMTSWFWDFGDGTTSTDSVPSKIYDSAGIYQATLVVADISGCTDTITKPVVVVPNPAFHIETTDPFCFGSNEGSASAVIETGMPPFNYSWSTDPPQTGATATGLTAGNYLITVTAGNICYTLDSVEVSEPPELILELSHSTLLCDGDKNGEATVTVNGGMPPYTYLWDNTHDQTTATATGLSIGNYKVTITDANGCTVDTSFELSASPPLELTISHTDPGCFEEVSGSAQVSVTGGTPHYNYRWSSGSSTTTATGLRADVSYYVTVVDNNGCTATDSVRLNQPLKVTVVADDNRLCGEDNCEGILRAIPSGGTPPYGFRWNDVNSSETQTVSGLCPGEYAVTLMDFKGCTAIDTTNIISFPTPEGRQWEFILCHGTVLSMPSSEGVKYKWGPTTGLSDPNIRHPVLRITESKTYYVEVTNDNECVYTDTVRVNLKRGTAHTLFIPNAFSPNDDGFNDAFEYKGNFNGILTFESQIWNRWGEKIFQSDDITNFWNGRYNNTGGPVKDGIYVYIIKVTDECSSGNGAVVHTKSGWVMVSRGDT